MKMAKARRGDAEMRRRGEKESANLMRLLYLRVPASPRLRVVVFSLLLLSSCKREERGYRVQPPAAGRVNSVSLSELRPGETLPPPAPVKNEYENNAYAMNEGKRLYEWFNCVGCHAHGGGAIGPPLMDDKWIYGSQPEQVFSTIVQGRPNGMPSFSGKIPDYEVWQLVAYVRSMSGQVPGDAAPGRNDDMNTTKPEQVKGKEEPKGSGEPK